MPSSAEKPATACSKGTAETPTSSYLLTFMRYIKKNINEDIFAGMAEGQLLP
jgi:hypothetical protein